MNDIVKAIRGSKTFLICMHIDPDGDAIGSASAFASILKKTGKTYKIYSPSKMPDIYRFLKHMNEVVYELDGKEKFDVLVALDCGDIKRIGPEEKVRKLAKFIVNIDHHGDNTKFGDINYTRKSSSTGELIYDLTREMKYEIDKGAAEALYVAIITDTGRFKYDNTTEKTFRAAAELVRLGVDPHSISVKIYESRSREEIRILGRALDKIEISADGKISWIKITRKDMKETGAKPEDMNGIVDYIRSIKSVEVAFFLREQEDGSIKVNFRSKSKNIQKIAKKLGGGGHAMAAGAVIDGSIDEAADRILAVTKGLWTEL